MSRPELRKGVATDLSPLPHETVSIALSTDRTDLQRVLVKDLVVKKNLKKGTFLFDGSNTDFLGLEHSLGSGQKMKLGIRIADPHGEVINKLFEKDYLQTTRFELERQRKLKELESKDKHLKAVEAERAAAAAAAAAQVSGPKPDKGKEAAAEVIDEFVAKELIATEIDKAKFINENLKFYVAYGVGSDTSLWAGPFICMLRYADYIFEDHGIPILQLTFVADIVFDITLEAANNQILFNNPITSPPPTTVRHITRTRIGSIKTKSQGTDPPSINISTRDIQAAIGETHRKWAKAFGITNFIHIVPKLLLDIPEFGSGGAAQVTGAFMSNLEKQMALLGFVVKREMVPVDKKETINKGKKTEEEKEEKIEKRKEEQKKAREAPKPGAKKAAKPKASKVEKPEKEEVVFINISEKYMEITLGENQYNNFMKPFDDFYAEVGKKHTMSLDYGLYTESNYKILQMLQKDSYTRYGYAIKTLDAPLYVLAERSIMQMEMYGGGLKVLLPAETPTTDKYKTAIKEYITNKLFHTRLPSSWQLKNKNEHLTDPYSQLTPGKKGAFNLGGLAQSVITGILGVTESAIPLPVFESNTPNSNILSYSLDQAAQATVALKFNAPLLAPTPEDKFWLGLDIKEELKKLAESYTGADFLIATGRGFDLDEITKNIVDIIATPSEEGYTLPRLNSTDNEDGKKLALRTYLRFFWETAIMGGTRGVIKTVPMFHLSDLSLLGQQCVVNIFKSPILTSRDTKKALYNTTYSGLYKITGWRHVLNGGEAYSEFYIFKNTLPRGKKGSSYDRGFDIAPEEERGSTDINPIPKWGVDPSQTFEFDIDGDTGLA